MLYHGESKKCEIQNRTQYNDCSINWTITIISYT